MHEHLFAQAELLANADTTRPRQVNLRRAVSSVYYGAFHYLVDESCCLLFGSQHGSAAFRHVIGRAFLHSAMKQACVAFAVCTLKDAVIRGLPRDPSGRYPIHAAIRDMAEAFAELQEKRNRADYDRNERFKRSEVKLLIQQAKARTARFAALSMTDDKRFFLACLWAWKELANR